MNLAERNWCNLFKQPVVNFEVYNLNYWLVRFCYPDTVKPGIDTVNDLVKSYSASANDSILLLIKNNANITSAEISQHLNISLSTAKRTPKELKVRGMIKCIGSDKTGFWKIEER